MTSRTDIYNEIEEAIKAAAAKGLADVDEDWTRNDWLAFANAYLGRASDGVHRNNDDPREMVIKAAGLLVRALEVNLTK